MLCRRYFQCSFFALILIAIVVGCAAGSAHENFKSLMQLQVGRNIDNPYYFGNRYAGSRIATRTLANGNSEEEFPIGYRHRCRVFFEIDKSTRTIIGWRYEGVEENCGITP
jgi:hypothetical protein